MAKQQQRPAEKSSPLYTAKDKANAKLEIVNRVGKDKDGAFRAVKRKDGAA